jgi:hypothetical protein
MTEVKLGAGTAVRIEESYEPNFEARTFFPDWDPAVVDRHRGWLVPAHYDEASPSSSSRAARGRCSAATSSITRCRSITPSGTALHAPTPLGHARAGAKR